MHLEDVSNPNTAFLSPSTMSAEEAPLKWSAQYTLASSSTHRLQGDKIILPPAALEQLLAASTMTAQQNGFQEYNGFGHPAVQQQQNLPHPLMFRLVNPANGRVAHAGIREFSAEEGEMQVSAFLQEALGVESTKDDENGTPGPPRLTVHAQSLPRGTFVRFRPLEAGYNPEDWKALLEKYMRTTFTTLTMGEILTIPSGKEQYRFLIDKVSPEGEGICIVDTDLEVDIEPLNEEQARETLKQIQEKARKSDGSSSGGVISVDRPSEGHVMAGDYVDYTIRDWDRSKALQIELQTDDPEAVDIFASPMSSRQRAVPRLEEHLFDDISDRPSKRICIRPTNVELEGADAVAVSVSGYSSAATDSQIARPFTLIVHNDAQTDTNGHTSEDTPPNDGDVRCKNCNQWVPSARMFLHENFCLRNNIRCPQCKEVFQKSSDAWKQHWHCPHDDAYGNSAVSEAKHNTLAHTPATCTSCGEETSDTLALARHRVTVCPDKEILCQFCHLLVPQKGPEDPEFTDPEVMLSGLTPHELADGGRTTECHLCSKIVRLRDMTNHLKSHDLDRLSRPVPRLCRNANCGRTLDGVGPRGQIKAPQASRNDVGLCDTCFGPLYNSAHDPEHKALRRRVERRYLTQLVTGCGQSFCRNEYCKNGRFQAGFAEPGTSMSSKEALMMTRPELDRLVKLEEPLHFCTDEQSQKRRVLAEMIAVGHGRDEKGLGYGLPWCVAALEAEGGDLARARQWLENFAPTRSEER